MNCSKSAHEQFAPPRLPQTPKNRKAIGPRPIGLGSRPIAIGVLPFRIGPRPIGLGSRPIPIGFLPFRRGFFPFRRGSGPIRKRKTPPSTQNPPPLHSLPRDSVRVPRKVEGSAAAERSNAQSFVIDLCAVLNVDPPHAATSDGDRDALRLREAGHRRDERREHSIGFLGLFKRGHFHPRSEAGRLPNNSPLSFCPPG